jgi:hypothetical protein
MTKMMDNGRFPIAGKVNYIFSCNLKRHQLVEKINFEIFNSFLMTKITLNLITFVSLVEIL